MLSSHQHTRTEHLRMVLLPRSPGSHWQPCTSSRDVLTLFDPEQTLIRSQSFGIDDMLKKDGSLDSGMKMSAKGDKQMDTSDEREVHEAIMEEPSMAQHSSKSDSKL